MLHSDGAIRDFLPDVIEDGIELIDPVQVQCAGMDMARLKRDFGADLTFHGAIDTQRILPFATPDAVRAEVVRCMQALGPGGGFILAPCHNIQAVSPPENVVAMYETAYEEGAYAS